MGPPLLNVMILIVMQMIGSWYFRIHSFILVSHSTELNLRPGFSVKIW